MSKSSLRFVSRCLLAVGLALLTACGGGDSSSSTPIPPEVTYTVGGTVTGLTGSGLVLRINTGGELEVSAAGAFTFADGLNNGTAYEVAVETQPSSPAQKCIVTNGSGTVSSSNITNVTVDCVQSFAVGGTVTGLAGSGLVLVGSFFGNDNAITANGAFILDNDRFSPGDDYQVLVAAQPASPTQDCVVANGFGRIDAADVNDVSVMCSGVGHFAYAANAGDNTISVYAIDSTTGALAAVGVPVATGLLPYAIAAHPDRAHVYVSNEASNNISEYSVNSTTGALTPILGSPVATGTDPQALAFVPSGDYLYVADNGSNDLSAYAVDPSSGALSPLSPAQYATGAGPSSVVIDPAGKFVVVASNDNTISVFAIAAGSGALTPVPGSPFAATTNPDDSAYSLAFGASGKYLYAATANSITGSTVSGFSVDPVTGVLTPLDLGQFAVDVDHYIGTDRQGLHMYATKAGTIVRYDIDARDGALFTGPSFTAGANTYSVIVDPSNQFLYVGNDGDASISAFKLDATSGELTIIPGSPFAAGDSPDFITIL